MTPQERDDARRRAVLAERMVTKACEFACLVRDHDSAAIGEFVQALSDEECTALLIVQAAMIPIEQTTGDLLAWVDFDEYGRPLSAPRAANGRVVQPCGTYAAWQRHKRRGEAPCGACETAAAKWKRNNAAAAGGWQRAA